MADRIPPRGRRSVGVGGDVSGSTIITGDVLFQLFAHAPLAYQIRVQAFQTLVNERTRNFVGREFVFTAIDGMLNDPNFLSGYIVIRGEPGIGKTSLLSQLVKFRGYVHHFNISPQNIRLTRDFLTNICAQLIARYELNHTHLPPEAESDSGFLSQLLAEVVAKQPNQPVIILIDALDEAEDLGLPPTVNRLYLPSALPSGVFFIITTREKADERLTVDRRQDIYLRDDDPQNLNDVRHYIQNFIEEHREQVVTRIQHWGIAEDGFVSIITEKSQGNFMYLVYVLGDIRDGKLGAANVDNIRDLPRGLHDYYQRHWRTMRAQNPEIFKKYYEPVIGILATVLESVTVDTVAEWTDLPARRVKEVIDVWLEFLNVEDFERSEPRYRVYHPSFQRFLEEETKYLNEPY